MKETIRPAIVSLLAFTVLCGFVYPLAMDGIAALVFPHQATGSLITDGAGVVVGSELLGQPFDNPAYFWSRLTAEANYDASSSTGTNLGQSSFVDDKGHLGPNIALAKAAKDRIDALRAADPGNTAPVPVDLVTSSASGLDPTSRRRRRTARSAGSRGGGASPRPRCASSSTTTSRTARSVCWANRA